MTRAAARVQGLVGIESNKQDQNGITNEKCKQDACTLFYFFPKSFYSNEDLIFGENFTIC